MGASLFGSVEVGFALPECPHDDSRNWHMCSQKRVGQRGVEGKDYSYLFVDWRRGEVIPPFVGLFETRITRPIYTGSVS